jgi:pilus assembly protein CpaC
MKNFHTLLPVLAFAGSLSCSLLGDAHAWAPNTPPATAAAGGEVPAVGAQAAPALRKRRAARPPLQYLPIKTISIPLGEIMMLPTEGKVERLALGSGAVLSTTTVDGNLLLIAEQVGFTSLLVWTPSAVHSYRVTVVPKSLAEMQAKVELLTRGMDGIKVEQIGSELVLTGVAHREALRRLRSTLGDAPGVVVNVREDEGSEYTRSVLFRLHFIEVKKSLLEQIGINWVRDANGPTLGAMGVAHSEGVYDNRREASPGENLLVDPPPFVRYGNARGGLFFGLATTITSRLRFGISNGDVRVLSSPELTARSGGKAELQVGGQVPVPISGALGATSIEYKDYGVILRIAPTIDANDVVTASIHTEMSQIDPAVSVSNVPGFLRRSTSTEVSLKGGEMVALAGLVNRDMADAVDRVPALSKVPVLGRLFRSDDFRNNKTELIVLLEPEIIRPGDGLAQQLRSRGQGAMHDFEDRQLELERKRAPLPVAPSDDELYRQ